LNDAKGKESRRYLKCLRFSISSIMHPKKKKKWKGWKGEGEKQPCFPCESALLFGSPCLGETVGKKKKRGGDSVIRTVKKRPLYHLAGKSYQWKKRRGSPLSTEGSKGTVPNLSPSEGSLNKESLGEGLITWP